MKQCKSNPWSDYAAHHQKGEKIKGVIKSITDFGVFIGLDGEIDGLVHLSDLSWDMSPEEAVRNFNKGQEVEAVILGIDPERERVSLGIKQLSGDAIANYARGDVLTVQISAVDAKQADVQLDGDIKGVIKASEVSSEAVQDVTTVLSVGDSVQAKVLSVDRKDRLVQLSIKAKDIDDQKQVLNDLKSSPVQPKLGDLLQNKINNDQ
jgi:small subunit ribosomal protein S1